MFRDREYYTTLLRFGLPIALQNLVSTALNAVGVLLIGQLGETSVAAVGLGNQIFFLLSLMLFGITSGSAIFTAQFWGNQELAGIRKVVGFCMAMGLTAGAFFTVIALGFPSWALGLYTNDPAVIVLGSQYLRIVGVSYLATAVTLTFANNLRSTGNVRTPMLVSMVALGSGTVLNYILIFGKFGMPVMGVAGVALGTCIARLGEAAAMVAVTYGRKLPVAFRLSDMRNLSKPFVKKFFVTVLPVWANETVWSLGITIYNVIYAHIGTEAIAAVNIASTIESLAFVLSIGLGNATSIMIGNKIGAGETERARQYGWRGLTTGWILAVVLGGSLIALSPTIVSWYKVSGIAAQHARNILLFMGCIMWAKVSNHMLIVGILRAGGDTRYSLFLDAGSVWLAGIPMGLLGAFVLHLPVYWVVVMIGLADELVKLTGGMLRFISGKWVNNLAGSMDLTT
jgi:putative MATE family efflux protein